MQFLSDKIPKLLLKYVKSLSWSSYLDIGCGEGVMLRALYKVGFFENKAVYAVDISPSKMNIARGVSNTIKFYTGDACNLHFLNCASIDIVVSMKVIEHVTNEGAMIGEISRVISKNGILYLTTVYKKQYAWYFYRSGNTRVLDPTHVREYEGEAQLVTLLAHNNLCVLENTKKTIRRPVMDFLLSRVFKRVFVVPSDIYLRSRLLRFLRIVQVPIPGYYTWTLVCRKC